MFRYPALLAVLVFSWPGAVFAQHVNVLVVAIYGVETAYSEWQPTIDYLNKSLPEHQFNLVPVIPSNLVDMHALLEQQKIEFIITQPAIYVDLEINFGVSKILTMVKRGGAFTVRLRHYCPCRQRYCYCR